VVPEATAQVGLHRGAVAAAAVTRSPETERLAKVLTAALVPVRRAQAEVGLEPSEEAHHQALLAVLAVLAFQTASQEVQSLTQAAVVVVVPARVAQVAQVAAVLEL
jgi:hypothetical protein